MLLHVISTRSGFPQGASYFQQTCKGSCKCWHRQNFRHNALSQLLIHVCSADELPARREASAAVPSHRQAGATQRAGQHGCHVDEHDSVATQQTG